MASNYDDALAQLTGHGLLIDRLLADGRVHRCRVDGEDRENRGWYKLSEWVAGDGALYLVGVYGVWHGTDPGTLKIEPQKSDLNADERAALRARLAADRKQAKAARAASAARAARRAAKVWSQCAAIEPDGGCAYLSEKSVAPIGVRFTDSGALVVPMTDPKGAVHGLQFVLPPAHPHIKKTGRRKTYWPAGIEVTGHYHALGHAGTSDVCLLAEGYATAATLHAATGLPTIVAFAANNLQPVAMVIAKAYRCRVLVCGDDDYLTDGNPGQSAAAAAALAVDGAWCVPHFPGDRGGEKLTDFNDLAAFPGAGLHVVGTQVADKLASLGWRIGARRHDEGGGDGETLKPLLSLDEACARYSLIYGAGGTLFDHDEHALIPKGDVLDILPDRSWGDWKLRPDRRLVRLKEVGFDPTESDESLRCNLWGGWPTAPVRGSCERLLELLDYLCGTEQAQREAVREWVLDWLAYPLQHPGAKMKSALVFHGPQGVGKNLFFEAVMAIYGEYGRIVDQAAIEDKFNDWASRKLFLVCDEVVARMELYHTKNKLKSLITGDWIRINPKNVAPHDERNHVNLVFLSNERQPLVLERDDRRYMVVYVPDKLPAEFYKEVGDEIAHGGIAALHAHLLARELGEFKPWTAPIPTAAKSDLIAVSMESSERFIAEWVAGDLGWPFGCCGSMHLYTAYRRWANTNGVRHPRESNQFLSAVHKTAGWTVRPCHINQSPDGLSGTRSQKMVIPPPDLLERAGQARGPDQTAAAYYTGQFWRFHDAVHDDAF